MSETAVDRAAIVVMGVSGSGKTTIGRALASARRLDFVDGDGLHPAANVAKMRAGEPLDDADRAPWLDAVARTLDDRVKHPAGVVVACSALRRAYRDRLRAGAPGCAFLYLALIPEVALDRVGHRPGHFMPTSLVANQFATLEVPTPDEVDVTAVDASLPVAAIIGAVADHSMPA